METDGEAKPEAPPEAGGEAAAPKEIPDDQELAPGITQVCSSSCSQSSSVCSVPGAGFLDWLNYWNPCKASLIDHLEPLFSIGIELRFLWTPQRSLGSIHFSTWGLQIPIHALVDTAMEYMQNLRTFSLL